MPHTEQPKCCAVCWEPLDRVQTTNDQITFDKTNNWLHAGELVRPRDHPAIPVDYDDEKVQVVCDFCKAEVNRSTCFSVPAKDFTVPVIPHRSIGSWATCPDCAELVRANDWDALVDRAAKSMGEPPGDFTRKWLHDLYELLVQNMTGPVRPWQPGDENV